MKYLPFGNTGISVSEVGFGAIPIIRLSFADAEKTLRRAFDKGVTLFDTANAYHDSEEKIGAALSPVRDKVFLATKTMKRDGPGTAEHIDLSLKRMKTDYIDLFQFHQAAKESDWEKIAGPGGAMEAAMKARDEGKIRFIGITSHSLPMAIKFTKSGLFSSVQFPFNFIEPAAAEELHPLAKERGVAVLSMKPFGGGAIADADLAFKFLRSHGGHFPIPGFDSPESVEQILKIYESPNVVTDEDGAAMEAVRGELGGQFCRRCEYCMPCPFGVNIPGGMIYPLQASRMSPEVSRNFAAPAMETLSQCTDCGLCMTKCPYTLPIPEMLRKHYELYISHKEAGF